MINFFREYRQDNPATTWIPQLVNFILYLCAVLAMWFFHCDILKWISTSVIVSFPLSVWLASKDKKSEIEQLKQKFNKKLVLEKLEVYKNTHNNKAVLECIDDACDQLYQFKMNEPSVFKRIFALFIVYKEELIFIDSKDNCDKFLQLLDVVTIDCKLIATVLEIAKAFYLLNKRPVDRDSMEEVKEPFTCKTIDNSKIKMANESFDEIYCVSSKVFNLEENIKFILLCGIFKDPDNEPSSNSIFFTKDKGLSEENNENEVQVKLNMAEVINEGFKDFLCSFKHDFIA